MKQWAGAYVAHECKKCGKAFIAEDYTNAKSLMPTWRYCEDCAKEKGIDYASQTPKTNRTPEEQKKIDEKIERLRQYQFVKK